MFSAALLLLLGSPQASGAAEYVGADPAAAIDAALRACGIQHFTVFYDDTIQSIAVDIRDNQASGEELRCVHDMDVRGVYHLYWPTELRTRYWRMAEAIARPKSLSRAQAYFDGRPELGPVPVRQAGQSAIDFARELERFCGPEAQRFFTDEYGGVSISSEWLQLQRDRDPEQSGTILACLSNAAALSDLPFGFVSNPAPSGKGDEG
ncbi:MAG: hypothetical protein AAF697_04485 [Pseudomonadota bacterium]